jgi:hypothetical protein
VLEIEWTDLADRERLRIVVEQLNEEGLYDANSKEFVRYPA